MRSSLPRSSFTSGDRALWRTPMRRMLLCVGLVVLGLGTWKVSSIMALIAEHSSFAPPPEAVTSSTSQRREWRAEIPLVGSLEAIQGVVLRAEEAGRVARVEAASGSEVAAGAVIAQLDVSVEEAELKSAEAKLEWARVNMVRAEALQRSKATSQSLVDDARVALQQAAAAVDSSRSLIGRKTIRAPFGGRVGIRKVNLGEYVQQGQEIVPLFQMDPLHLKLFVPQQDVGRVGLNAVVEVEVPGFADRVFSGKVTALNPQVDSVNRNVEVQATVGNEDGSLRPGMFVRARLITAERMNVVTVPITSVSYNPYGDSVFVVESMKDPKGREYKGVRQQIVRLGERRGDMIAVLDGLKGGEEIVTSGVFKLRPSAEVTVVTSVAPSESESPQPMDS